MCKPQERRIRHFVGFSPVCVEEPQTPYAGCGFAYGAAVPYLIKSHEFRESYVVEALQATPAGAAPVTRRLHIR